MEQLGQLEALKERVNHAWMEYWTLLNLMLVSQTLLERQLTEVENIDEALLEWEIERGVNDTSPE